MSQPWYRAHGHLDDAQALEHFEEAWQRGAEPCIHDFLPPATADSRACRRHVLEELIKIDLERRWRSAGHPANAQRRLLEDYIQQHPELGGLAECSVELIVEEFRVRRRWGDRPGAGDYAARFPEQGRALLERLAQADAEIAAEYALRQGSPGPRTEREDMPVSRTSLIDTCARLELLSPAQLRELDNGGLSGVAESHILARELVRRGWLGPYQVNRLLQGRAGDLRIGPYLILVRLGEGGAGQVFKACHLTLNRLVALKVIRQDLVEDAEAIGRFYREMAVVGQLSHPNVVHAFDAGPVGSVHVLVMEYVEGTDLNQLIKKSGPLAVAESCDYIRQAALGLQHAHERGLVHRDIKPANLLVGRTAAGFGTVKIADLGLARLRQSAGDLTLSPTLTPRGSALMGTPDYLAPEQALDFHGADIRADIYSLGCTFYYLLTGQPPFPGNLTEKLLRHQQEEPPALERFRGDVPSGLSALLRKMMAKRPADRWQTPADVAAALVDLGHGARTRIRPVNRRRWLAAVGTGGVLVLGGVAARLLWPSEATPSASTGAPALAPMPSAPAPSPLDRLALQKIEGGTMSGGDGTRPFQAFPWPVAGGISGIAIRPDAGLVAAATCAGPILLWDAVTLKTRSLPGHAGGTLWVAFAADKRTLASGGIKDNVVKLWDVNEGTGSANCKGHTAAVTCGTFAANGLLATGDAGGDINLWDLAAGGKPTRLGRRYAHVFSLDFAPDGRTLASGGYCPSTRDPSALLWDVVARQLRMPLDGNGVGRVAFAPDGKMLAVARNTNVDVERYDVATGNKRISLRGHRQTLRAVAYSPDGTRLASAVHGNEPVQGGQVILWQTVSGTKQIEWELPGVLAHVGLAFSPDGRHLVTATRHSVYILRIGTAALL
jgi:serine/threonine protein kinase